MDNIAQVLQEYGPTERVHAWAIPVLIHIGATERERAELPEELARHTIQCFGDWPRDDGVYVIVLEIHKQREPHTVEELLRFFSRPDDGDRNDG